MSKANIAESNIELGATYKDSVSGFEGVAQSSTRFLFSCERVYLVSGHDEKGKEISAVFDAAQLVFKKAPSAAVKKALAEIGIVDAPKKPKTPVKTGGTRDTPSAVR